MYSHDFTAIVFNNTRRYGLAYMRILYPPLNYLHNRVYLPLFGKRAAATSKWGDSQLRLKLRLACLLWFTCCPGFVRLDTRRFSKIRPSKTLKQPIEDSDACSSFSTASNLSDPNFPGSSFIVSIFGPQNGYKQLKENTFLDLVPCLLGLDTFHGPYYNSFGDGCPSFGPAHPPAGPAHPPAHPLWIDSPSWRLDRNSSDSRGLELRYSTMQHGRKHFSTLCGSVPPSLFCPLLNSYFSHLFGPFSVAQGLSWVSTWVKVP